MCWLTPSSVGGAKHFFCSSDEFSKYRKVYFIKQMSETKKSKHLSKALALTKRSQINRLKYALEEAKANLNEKIVCINLIDKLSLNLDWIIGPIRSFLNFLPYILLTPDFFSSALLFFSSHQRWLVGVRSALIVIPLRARDCPQSTLY